MNKNEVKQMQEIIDATDENKTSNLLVIKTKNKLKATKKGVEINQGYEFEVDGAMPEIADAIAKFAKELPKNGFGEHSDTYFITLIKQYFDKL